VKVGTEWKYLYRAIDSTGQTIELMLSAKRDVPAAKRFFKRLMRANHRRPPFTRQGGKYFILWWWSDGFRHVASPS
jgi:transposase-like protein